MLKSHFVALTGLALLGSTLLAAPPAGTNPIAPKGEPALAGKIARPRAAAFASALYPDVEPAAKL